MVTQTASTGWTGTLRRGSGQVELVSSQTGNHPVAAPKRTGQDVTSPEELLAAALSSCYAMALAYLVEKAGGEPADIDVRADVGVGPDGSGERLRLTGITLTVRATVGGLDADAFARIAHEAEAQCPIGSALGGVEITLDAALGG